MADLLESQDGYAHMRNQLGNLPLSNLKNLGVEMGMQCNVRCLMCSQVDFRPRPKKVDSILKERLSPGLEIAENLTLSGGEPTIIPSAHELVCSVMEKHAHLRLSMTTNGLRFRGIWEEVFLKQGHVLNFSLNAISPSLYERIVQFGRQDDVMKNIDRLVKKRCETNSRLRIRISSVILNETIHEMPVFIQWAADHGLDEVVLAPDQIRHVSRYSPAEIQSFIAQAYETSERNPQVRLLQLQEYDNGLALRTGIRPVRSSEKSPAQMKPCLAAFDSLFIHPYGFAFPCPSCPNIFGNLVHQSLEEVWNSRSATRYRSRMLDLDFRDCCITCGSNVRPVKPLTAEVRRTYWILRRDPIRLWKKGLRRLGLTTAQIGKRRVIALTA